MKTAVRDEFKEVMAKYRALDEWRKNGIHNIAMKQLQEDFEGTGQGISSSDISCRIFAIMKETDGEFPKIIELAKEEGLL